MGKKKNFYSVEFKINVIKRYNSGEEGGVKALSKKLGFRSNTMLRDWLKKYNEFGAAGLDSKRGKSLTPMRGRPKKTFVSHEEEILKLKAENEYLKQLLKINQDNIKKK
jgi:transposase